MKVSIIVPIYQVEEYIEETILSIARQTYKDFEVILVNDGTKDNSVNVAKTVLDRYNVYYQIINKENGGQSSARNVGIKKASGEYIVFIDSDDVIRPNYLQVLVKAISAKCDFSFCNYQFISKQKLDEDLSQSIRQIELKKEEMIKRFLKRNINFLITTILFKRKFILDNDLFFDEKTSFSEDQMYIWKAIFVSKKVIYVNQKNYGYYIRPKSIMTSSNYEKIYNGYCKYQDFCSGIEDVKLSEKILARWKLGAIYTSAKILNYQDFLKLYKCMNVRFLFFTIIKIAEIKSLLLSFICFSPIILYKVCRRV